jgi:hypothetical protein
MAAISKYYLIDFSPDTKQPIKGVSDTIEGIVKQWERSHQQYVIMTPVTWKVKISDVTNAVDRTDI